MTTPQIAFLGGAANIAIGVVAAAWPWLLIGTVIFLVLTVARSD